MRWSRSSNLIHGRTRRRGERNRISYTGYGRTSRRGRMSRISNIEGLTGGREGVGLVKMDMGEL